MVPLGSKPFASPFYSIGREICQNMFLENAQSQNAKAQYFLLKIPGLRRFTALSAVNLGACRCMFTTSGFRTFSVNGNCVREIYFDGTSVIIGSINTYTGPVQIAENGALLCIVDGSDGWILREADNNLTRISDEYFPGNGYGTLAPTHVTFLDTYFIVNNPESNQYYYSTASYVRDHDNTSTVYDPEEPNGYWTPLQMGMKIGKADNVSALVNCNNYLWLFGYNSCEIHYDSGDYNGQQFKRYQGAILNVGCTSPYSVAVYQNNVFFLGTDKDGTLGVFSNDGMAPIRISTRGIEQMIESMGVRDDCVAYCYAQSGHSFYVMQFPGANRTLVFDIQTSSWHERTHLVQSTGLLRMYDGMFATFNFNKLLMGDAQTSAVYQSDPGYYQNDNPLDNGVNYIRCVKTTPILFQNGVRVIYYTAQVICNQGSGTTVDTPAGVGTDPHVQLAWSDDSGQTWSNERSAPIGKQGQYDKRSIIVGCGSGRNRVFQIAMTDPVPFQLVSLLLSATPCTRG
jgi:hypothetical protein